MNPCVSRRVLVTNLLRQGDPSHCHISDVTNFLDEVRHKWAKLSCPKLGNEVKLCD